MKKKKIGFRKIIYLRDRTRTQWNGFWVKSIETISIGFKSSFFWVRGCLYLVQDLSDVQILNTSEGMLNIILKLPFLRWCQVLLTKCMIENFNFGHFTDIGIELDTVTRSFDVRTDIKQLISPFYKSVSLRRLR